MTVASAEAKAGPYTGNDVATAFAFSFKVFADTDIRVVEALIATGVETDLVLNGANGYTVTRNIDQDNNPGGTITYQQSSVAAALPGTKTLNIVGNYEYEQPTDIPNGGAFFAQVVENALDRVTMLVKQLKEMVGRSLTLPVSVTGVSTELPVPDALKLLRWNEDETALENTDAQEIATDIVYGTTQADLFSGTGAQTVFALTYDPAAIANMDVSVGGVTQRPGIDYLWSSGTVLTFTTAPPLGTSNILVRYAQALPQGSMDAAGVRFVPVSAIPRTVQDKLGEFVSVKDFGAVGDGVTNDWQAFQNAANWGMSVGGATVFVPKGSYRVVGQITQDRSANTALGVVNFEGAGRTATVINHSGASSLFSVTGHGTAVEGQTKDIRLSGMTLLGVGTAGSTAVGYTLVSFPHFEDLDIQGFDYAYYLQDVDHVSFDACVARFNLHGLFTRKNPVPVANSTMPNQYTFNECHWGANAYYGLFNGGGSAWAFSGGSIESNGGSDSVNGFGLRCENCAYEGGSVVAMNGTYVESNNGLADIILLQTSASALVSATYNFNGVTFNRASSTSFSTNTILTNFAAVASVGQQIVNLNGCAFKSFGAYSPSAGRPYLNWSGAQGRTAKNFSAPGTIFEDAVESPPYVQNITKPFTEVAKNGSQTITNATPTIWQLDTTNFSFSWSTVINGSFQVPIPADGVWQINTSLTFTGAVANTMVANILAGGAAVATNATTGQSVIDASCTKYLTAGTLISVQITQNSGGSVTLAGSGSALSYLNLTKLVDA